MNIENDVVNLEAHSSIECVANAG